MKKGDTHLAIYALGSMRDARLNRMWQGSKVTFLQPVATANNDDDAGNQDTTPKFFNLFALHQNRDKGRGTKNCVHEGRECLGISVFGLVRFIWLTVFAALFVEIK